MAEKPDGEPSLPSARQLAWLLVQPTSALDAVAAAVVARVEQDATAKAVADLARRFTALVRASGLDGDGTAVRAALTEAWSSDQAEDQINRLKLIKRQSYGRAGLDLLQRRMVLVA